MNREGFKWDALPTQVGTITNPAAGTAPTVTVPAGERWLFLGAYMTLATDANVATRYPRLQVQDDGTNLSREFVASNTVTASQTVVVTYNNAATPTGVNNVEVAVATGMLEVNAGAVLTFSAINKQATDDWSAVYYVFKKGRP